MLWLVVVALVALAGAAPDDDEEEDSAPFVVLVEDSGGTRCGASLVSARAALSSVRCVLGARRMWVRAAGRPGRRRVTRVATPAGGALGDPALLELEDALGRGARPILMATRDDECRPGAQCHVVRALGPRLRIVDEALVQCQPAWPPLSDAPLCLAGPELCSEDRGAGVVCKGQLCGLLSRSHGGAGGAARVNTGEAEGEACGDKHEAQSVARWRRFLHCAHTLRSCGREGECSKLCVERHLFENEAEGAGEPPRANVAAGAGDAVITTDTPAGNVADASEMVVTGETEVLAETATIRDVTLVDETRSAGERAGGATRGAGGATRARTSSSTRPASTRAASQPPITPRRILHLSTALASRNSTTTRPRISSSQRRRTAARGASSLRRKGVSVSRPVRTTLVVSEPSSSPGSQRPAFEFEPNRADFKAGEYGDNAAEYGGDDGGGGGSGGGGSGSSSTSGGDVTSEAGAPDEDEDERDVGVAARQEDSALAAAAWPTPPALLLSLTTIKFLTT